MTATQPAPTPTPPSRFAPQIVPSKRPRTKTPRSKTGQHLGALATTAMMRSAAVRPTSLNPSAIDSGIERDLISMARRTVDEARASGVIIHFVGIEPLHDECRLLRLGPVEDKTRWVLLPSTLDPLVTDDHLPVPKRERRNLQRLVSAGLEFPVTYLAHEVPVPSSLDVPGIGPGHLCVPLGQGTALLPAVGASEHTQRVARGIGVVAGGAAYYVRRATRVAGRGTWAVVNTVIEFATLDPIVFGTQTLPGQRPLPGAPAAWFVLVRWNW